LCLDYLFNFECLSLTNIVDEFLEIDIERSVRFLSSTEYGKDMLSIFLDSINLVLKGSEFCFCGLCAFNPLRII